MFLKFFNINKTNIFLLCALLVYNSIFYAESLGVNVILFTLLLLAFQFVLFRESFKGTPLRLSLLLTLFTAVMIVLHNSLLGKWMFFISYGITLGFILQPQIRFIGYAFLTAVGNFGKWPFEFFRWNKNTVAEVKSKHRFSKAFFLSIIPLLITFLFFIIYRIANPVFAEVTDTMLDNIGEWITTFFKHISFGRILFMAFGIVLLSGILIRRKNNILANEDALFSDTIQRIRSRDRFPFLKIGFKNEVVSGIILLVLMNAMILGLNLIDLRYIWIDFKIPVGVSLKEMVHQGTEWLIVSIVLSMLVVMYLFRSNQNFYSKNKGIKILAALWMLQNMFLAISLLLRNNMYVDYHALAYKRLGVYVFIFLTFIGLVTMIIKVIKTKSIFYLLRINAWAAYMIMCGVCAVNWDIVIVKYNVNFENGAALDTDFYLDLSPKAFPVLFQNIDKIEKQLATHTNGNLEYLRYNNPDKFKEILEWRTAKYLGSHEKETWLSYNTADHEAIQYLKNR